MEKRRKETKDVLYKRVLFLSSIYLSLLILISVCSGLCVRVYFYFLSFNLYDLSPPHASIYYPNCFSESNNSILLYIKHTF